MKATRPLAAALIASGFLIASAGAASAGVHAPVAADDNIGWERTTLGGCLMAPIAANDSGDVNWLDIDDGAGSGAATFEIATGDDGVDQLQVCPDAGLRSGDTLVVTYTAHSDDDEAPTSMATVIITVSGVSAEVANHPVTVAAGVETTTEVAPDGTSPVVWVGMDDPDLLAAMAPTIEYGGRGITLTGAPGTNTVRYTLEDGTQGDLVVSVRKLAKADKVSVSVPAGISSTVVPVKGVALNRIWSEDTAVTTELDSVINDTDPTSINLAPNAYALGTFELSYSTADVEGILEITVVDPAAPTAQPTTSATAPAAAPATSGVPLPAVIGGGIAALALVGGATFLITRRRTTSTPKES